MGVPGSLPLYHVTLRNVWIQSDGKISPDHIQSDIPNLKKPEDSQSLFSVDRAFIYLTMGMSFPGAQRQVKVVYWKELE